MTLTQERIEKLHKAIEQAREPGGCQYVKDGAPCCVVAQLAVLEGVSLETLERWNRPFRDWDDRPPSIKELISHDDAEARSLVESYGRDLLADLQFIWDLHDRSEIEDRDRMRNRVAQELPGN